MIKLLAAFFFAVVLYFCAVAVSWVLHTDVATTFAFLLAVLIIEDRIPPQH